jgi:subtilisin family serine protease
LAGGIQTWSGTSFAAPMVSGAACLLASLNPSLRHDDVRALVCAGADDRVGGVADTAGFDQQYGWGRLNLASSLTLLQTSVTNFAWSGDALRFSWASPANASNKTPYRVEFAGTPAGPWQVVSNPASFLYTTNATHWLDDGGETTSPPGLDPTRLYRVRVKF